MKNNVRLNAQLREQTGKRSVRRIRRELDQIPGVIYGAGKQAQNIHFSAKELAAALADESTYSRILTLNIDGQGEQQAVLKQVQRHPSRPRLLHVDFLRIDMNKKLFMEVPIHLHGATQAPGVKDGGILSHHLTEVEIQCLPADLPQYIELDVSRLQLGHSLHLADLVLPSGVELTVAVADDEHNQPVVSILKPYVPSAEELASEQAAPEAKETEVIEKGGEEEESEK
ncbi:MAG: 50S ribosomal protein L25/general stress protein Ctc [Proteobacteria bacterium]|nr:50S ribosomal protein L25/general stress protein Ctc [Pseudomonadota bacterium]